MNTIKKFVLGGIISTVMLSFAGTIFAAPAPGAVIKNENANRNACWGMDRAFYSSMGYFPENMDIKQSFPGDVGIQLQDWIATYCWSHGPVEE